MTSRRSIALLSALVSFSWLSHTAAAEDVGDAKAGEAFARKVCAECHATGANEEASPNPDAPPFASVAATPGMNGRALAVWLQSSHPTMPNIILELKDRDDVIAYITSLKPSPPP